VLHILKEIYSDPASYLENPVLAPIAESLQEPLQKAITQIELKKGEVSYPIYGEEFVEYGARQQMDLAMRLPIAVGGALMPDAHHGYGLPIGGVLATENAIIPYGVGVDIGCRMCLSLFDLPADDLHTQQPKFAKLLQDHSKFGREEFAVPLPDPIFDRSEFKEIPKVKELIGRARKQIGSSGSGNHFVEFGQVKIVSYDPAIGLPPGEYLGLLSHSGSRGLGANLAKYYTKLAMDLHPGLPKQVKHLAWLDLDSEAGMEYWLAMNLAGDYASACHDHIHRRMAKALGEQALARVENHHNFAWKERLVDGREVIVHRKGATPAQLGVLGVIPGSMTAPGFIVRGRGVADSLQSASHGAGRQMSRKVAKERTTRHALQETLSQKGVTLIGGGLDESPIAYKDIQSVMRAQEDLVDVLGTFQPKVVRMAG
ncbi:MAG: RtcB family protein, partial [Bacteroidota bacterium]